MRLKLIGDAVVSAVKAHVGRECGKLSVRLDEMARYVGDLEKASKIPGPKGDKGDPGESIRGEKGDTGPAGESVRGEKGDKGDPGDIGPRGEPGPAGEKGMDGINGRDGLPGLAGLTGPKGLDGTNGTNGIDGKDGLGFDDLEVKYDGERAFTLAFVRGEQKKEFTFSIPVVLDRGVWVEREYKHGDGVTWAGSFWIAQKDTATKPDTAGSDWRLGIKRGREGKEGKPGTSAPIRPLAR